MTESMADRLRIQRQPQSQQALAVQLRELHIIAARVGYYDAADWIWKTGKLGGQR